MKKKKDVYIRRNRCTGCLQCTLICPFTQMGVFQPHFSTIQVADGGRDGFVPQICRNCEEAPCLDACPAGAIIRRKEDQHVILLKEECVGCNMCIMVCPFNAIRMGPETNDLCNTCEGQEKCAAVCEHQAVGFDDLNRYSKSKRRKSMDRMRQEPGDGV